MQAATKAVLLAPTDMSEASKRAVIYAVDLARRMGGSLILLHVLSQSQVDEQLRTGVFVDVQLENERTELLLWYSRVVPSAARERVQADVRTAVGDAAQEILALAKSMQVEMIVMATHGRTGLRRALFGSVAEAVLRHAPCPVLTVRAPDTGDAASDPISITR